MNTWIKRELGPEGDYTRVRPNLDNLTFDFKFDIVLHEKDAYVTYLGRHRARFSIP